MEVYRCCKCLHSSDLSGMGAYLYGGRWNSKGVHILYTAKNASLAMLETLVHMRPLLPTGDYCMTTLQIDSVSIKEMGTKDLGLNWNAVPAPDVLKLVGDQFVKEGQFLMLKIPSVVLPLEWNYLINPLHPDFKRMHLVRSEPVDFDKRLFV